MQKLGEMAHIKAALLSEGVAFSKEFLSSYGRPYLEKRRAYGNSDPVEFRNAVVPQEMYLLPDRLVCAVNIREGSQWILDCEDTFLLRGPQQIRVPVTFPFRPEFYDYLLRNGQRLTRVATLYGGASLGLFIYGNCSLVDLGKACQYCSIKPNHDRGTDFEQMIRPEQVAEAIELALTDEAAPIKQVMINGGNFREMNRSFTYYAEVTRAAQQAIERSKRDVELHLIVFPPQDFDLFHEMKETRASIAMNSEVFDPELFKQYCPGKAEVAGQEHLTRAMEAAAKILGPGRVYSIIVGGLEPVANTRLGMRRLADFGVTPVINVFHADPETPLAQHQPPSTDEIVEMGVALQDIYASHSFMRPFYADCGRNALDTEAYRRLF